MLRKCLRKFSRRRRADESDEANSDDEEYVVDEQKTRVETCDKDKTKSRVDTSDKDEPTARVETSDKDEPKARVGTSYKDESRARVETSGSDKSKARIETSDKDVPNIGYAAEELPIRKHKGDQDHSRLIKENRVYLVEHIDLNNSLILDQLYQDGVLSTTQLEAIKQENSTNHQRVSALLDVMNKKPHEDWIQFKLCLSRHNHKHIVKKINQESTGSITGHKRLQSLLAERMLTFYNKIDMWSWYDRCVTVPMDEVYVELVWIRTKDGFHSRRHHRLANYTEVFSEPGYARKGHVMTHPAVIGYKLILEGKAAILEKFGK